ncbi:hypothetical protein FGO68_gene14256 [Halteria grandinella]|uniref:Uncharacterized protein n=1 Tax=Halteria grandinella TaxID=5974 RepID=A0A8J8T6U4_HALGN|nr:hypothetical protein FGO68_gene14256 [Halteria grandinella]
MREIQSLQFTAGAETMTEPAIIPLPMINKSYLVSGLANCVLKSQAVVSLSLLFLSLFFCMYLLSIIALTIHAVSPPAAPASMQFTQASSTWYLCLYTVRLQPEYRWQRVNHIIRVPMKLHSSLFIAQKLSVSSRLSSFLTTCTCLSRLLSLVKGISLAIWSIRFWIKPFWMWERQISLLPTVFLMARGSNLPSLGLTAIVAKSEQKPATKWILAQPLKSTRPSLDMKPSPSVHPTTKGYMMIVTKTLKHTGTSIMVLSTIPLVASCAVILAVSMNRLHLISFRSLTFSSMEKEEKQQVVPMKQFFPQAKAQPKVQVEKVEKIRITRVLMRTVSAFFFLTEPYSNRKQPIWKSSINPAVWNW